MSNTDRLFSGTLLPLFRLFLHISNMNYVKISPIPTSPIMPRVEYLSLMRTNLRPTDDQERLIRETRDEEIKFLEEGIGEICGVSEQDIKTSIALHSNMLHPIRKLPSELLIKIWVFAAQSSVEGLDRPTRAPTNFNGAVALAGAERKADFWEEERGVTGTVWDKRGGDWSSWDSKPVRVLYGFHRHPWSAGEVCGLWRSVTRACPSLWRTIEINNPPGFQLERQPEASMLQIQLNIHSLWLKQRTFSVPLIVTLHIGTRQNGETNDYSESDGPKVLQMSSIFEELHLKMDAYSFNRFLLPHRFPILVTLSLHIIDIDIIENGWGITLDNSILAYLPSLRTLYCDPTLLEHIRLPLTQITQFHGFHSPHDVGRSFATILQTLNSLLQMPMTKLWHVKPCGTLPEPELEQLLPHVHSQLLTDLQCPAALLPFIDARKVETLDIVDVQATLTFDKTVRSHLIEFLHRNLSSIQHLKIHHPRIRWSCIIRILEDVDLQNLRHLEISRQVVIPMVHLSNFPYEYPEFSGVHVTVRVVLYSNMFAN